MSNTIEYLLTELTDLTNPMAIAPAGPDETVQLQVVAPRPELAFEPISEWALRRYRGGVDVLHGASVGGGERLNELFEARCDRYQRGRQGDRLAVETETESLTFGQLDELANQTARYLTRSGVAPGDRVGLLFDRSIWSYVSMLAVMKLGAAYVPMDKLFPPDRIQFIVEDSEITTILSVSQFSDLLAEAVGSTSRPLPEGSLPTSVIHLDDARTRIEAEETSRYVGHPNLSGRDLCYIIYTSGSTGRPKGVPITHANITNFIEVASEIYGLNPDDRIYQGLTLAFDFAVEEIWVPLIVGATLVPAPSDVTLIGPDLHEFLRDQRITAMCCVPTLLATIEPDLPELTFLLVSGEACPDELANRWHAEGRRFLNVYGPTEATVTATWTELRPDGKVTIGGPLPTYSIVVLHPEEARALPQGEIGEIGIAGPGLAPGYLNRDDKTEAAFVDDFIGIENNPSGRIYRTGDLGRINGDNEIEYLGRIDTQVKIRGYRIELEEIDSTLLEAPGVAQAVVIDHTPASGATELAAYYTLKAGGPGATVEELRALAKDRLPPYMVPNSFTELDELPMLPSHKVDRRRLPEPSSQRSAPPISDSDRATGETETAIAAVFAEVLGLSDVPTTGDYFDDLGASSLLLAHVCTELRTDARFAQVSVKDLYVYSTIRELAAHLGGPTDEDGGHNAAPVPLRQLPHRASRRQHITCGLLQLTWTLFGLTLGSAILALGSRWLLDAPNAGQAIVRSVVFGSAAFVASIAVSIAMKWLLIGRWRVEQIPVWSFRYFRYWAARSTIRANPMRLFAGTPLYNVYLRLLGAKIGRGASIFTRVPPVCTDLISIGDDVLIRPEVVYSGCKADDGYIVTGPVTVESHGYVGQGSVLDVDTEIGAFATLGHSSSLQSGQAVPPFQTWHGSPAEPTTTDYRIVPTTKRSSTRRNLFTAWQLVALVVGMATGGLILWLGERLLGGSGGLDRLPLSGLIGDFVALALLGSVLYGTSLVLGLLAMFIVPRLANRLIEPGRVYPLFGFHHVVSATIARFTNSKFYNSLFGDSSLAVGFLQRLGYDLGDPIQTGSNFGTTQQQGNPLLCRIGRGTMVSDGLSMMNVDYSATSFVCNPVSLGESNFIGNDIRLPAQSRLGDNCLLATKVLVPIDGETRSDTGLLGSPAFEIPRVTSTDTPDNTYDDPEARSAAMSRKLRHNMRTMAGFVAVGYTLFLVPFVPLVALGLNRESLSNFQLAIAVFAIAMAQTVFTVFFTIGVERLSRGGKALQPQVCSIYDPYFWYHERLWKLSDRIPVAFFTGTPLRPIIWRLTGGRIGKRVLDEGCIIVERTLTSVGDDACLNEGVTVQGHSLEDGVFKSDHIIVGSGATLGAASFIHYGTTIGDAALVTADSFLLKGETVPPAATWQGNPAAATRALPPWAPPRAMASAAGAAL